jgi:hypothetical protein
LFIKDIEEEVEMLLGEGYVELRNNQNLTA